MTITLTGGCLCGRIRYEADVDDDLEGYYCHCRMCQLAVGNTRAAFVNVGRAGVRWTRGAPRWHASSRFATRGFCGDCGTPLSFANDASPRMDLTVGSLDEPARLRPTSHFAVESRIAPWHADDGLPGQRLDESPSIRARWAQHYGDAPPGVQTARDGVAG